MTFMDAASDCAITGHTFFKGKMPDGTSKIFCLADTLFHETRAKAIGALVEKFGQANMERSDFCIKCDERGNPRT